MEYEEGLKLYKEGKYGLLGLEDFLFFDRLNCENIAVMRVSPCGHAKKQRTREYIRQTYSTENGKKIWNTARQYICSIEQVI